MSVPIAIKLCKVKDYIPIEDLAVHPDNPRQISKERLEDLKRSIVDKGFYEPILVWKKNGMILSGNHRFLAVKDLIAEGYQFNSPQGEGHVLPCVVVALSDEKANAILFETNNHYADWIEEKLSHALKQARDKGQDTTAFGFTNEYVDVMLKSALTDAEKIMDTPHIDTELDVDDAIGDSDEFESLILVKPVYEQATDLLSQIAIGLNEEWKIGDSYSDAMQALCQFAREKGVEVLWQKKRKTIRRTREERLVAGEISEEATASADSSIRSSSPASLPLESTPQIVSKSTRSAIKCSSPIPSPESVKSFPKRMKLKKLSEKTSKKSTHS